MLEAFEDWWTREGFRLPKVFWIDPEDLARSAWQARDAEIAALRAALAELVALKDLKDEMDRLVSEAASPDEWDKVGILEDEYIRRRPLAWDAARAAIDAQRKLC
jgi:hypothetical protein